MRGREGAAEKGKETGQLTYVKPRTASLNKHMCWNMYPFGDTTCILACICSLSQLMVHWKQIPLNSVGLTPKEKQNLKLLNFAWMVLQQKDGKKRMLK